jgi:hypothetical protein
MTPPPEEVPRDRSRGNEQGRHRHGNLGLARGRLAKEEPESWTGGTKLGSRCHRKVDLKRVWQQEYAIGGRAALEIGEVHRAEFIAERGRPVIENLVDGDAVGDAEREVQVGKPIAGVHSERPHDRSGYDAVILLRQP